MSDETYDGWKNHATWCVNLHLSNDRPLYNEALSLATVISGAAESDENIAEGIWTVDEARRFRVADAFKDWVTDELCGDYFHSCAVAADDLRLGIPDEPRLLIQDLIGGYLADVDWNEIADAWIEQVRDQVTT